MLGIFLFSGMISPKQGLAIPGLQFSPPDLPQFSFYVPAPQPSYLNFSVEQRVADINGLEAAVPQRIPTPPNNVDDDEAWVAVKPDVDVWYKYEFARSRFALSTFWNTFTLSLNIGYGVKLAVGHARAVLANCMGDNPEPLFSTQISDVVNWTSQNNKWALDNERSSPLKEERPCNLGTSKWEKDAFQYISPNFEKAISPLTDKFLPVGVKPLPTSLNPSSTWLLLSVPIPVGSQALFLEPYDAFAQPLRFMTSTSIEPGNTVISLKIGTVATLLPALASIATPPSVALKPFPANPSSQVQSDSSFVLPIVHSIELSALAHSLEKRWGGVHQLLGHRIVLTNFHFKGSGTGVLLRVSLEGYLNGTMYIRGEPQLSADARSLLFTKLAIFVKPSDESTAVVASWLITPGFVNQLEKKAVYEYDSLGGSDLKGQIKSALASRQLNGFSVQVISDFIEPYEVFAVPKDMVIRGLTSDDDLSDSLISIVLYHARLQTERK
jgi:hypothetical protein